MKNFVNGLVAQWRILDAKTWVGDELEARRFVMFFYIQQYHRAIWRLLERQPETLMYLTAVLLRHAEIDVPSADSMNKEQQRMLMEIFKRAFSHVLPHDDETLPENKDKHGSQKLDDAVSDFINRQDRKRSDEYLIFMFDKLIDANTPLKPHYLMLDTSTDIQQTDKSDE